MANRIPVVSVDHEAHRVEVDGRAVHLTPKEYELLRLLMRYMGKIVSSQQILKHVWKELGGVQIQSRTVNQHITRLRAKIGRATIRTVTNYGFIFERTEG